MATVEHPMLARARAYIKRRRLLGYAMSDAGRVVDFANFMDRVDPHGPLTVSRVLEWIGASPRRKHNTQAGLLSAVRGFARYCASFDASTQVPPSGLLGSEYSRMRPHIFTQAQIRLILSRARALTPRTSALFALTYETFIGLLACTGMRSGEARRLKPCDFDAGSGLLRVPRFKTSPERIIPLHPSTVRALQRYATMRRQHFPGAETFFAGANGKPLNKQSTRYYFATLSAGIRPNGDFMHPHMSDFRHTFASGWIARWSRERTISHHLTLLSRYLGHRSFASTWWYVTANPRSLRKASGAFLDFYQHAQSASKTRR